MTRSIDDRPVTIHELDRGSAGVRDSDRVEKKPAARGRAAVLWAIASTNVDVETIGLGFGVRFEEIFIRHGPDSSRVDFFLG